MIKLDGMIKIQTKLDMQFVFTYTYFMSRSFQMLDVYSHIKGAQHKLNRKIQ